MLQSNMKSVPTKACLLMTGDDAKSSFALSPIEGDSGKLSIVGYSGGVISGHWYWGDLVISTEGMSFPKDKYPVLLDHDTDRRIAFSDKPVVREDGSLFIETSQILDNENAKTFIRDSKGGFPFQASIRVEPTKIRRLEENETMMVNGFEFSGPGTVFVESIYKEVSACVFGWDSNTSSSAFADNNITTTVLVKETTMSATMEDWKSADPEGFAAFCNKLKDEAVASLTTELAKKDEQIAELTATNEANKAGKAELETRLSKLERDMALRAEAEVRSEFARIVDTASANLPTHMRPKFAKMFSLADYRTDTGAIDRSKLDTALANESAEWADALGNTNHTSILGGGRSAEPDNSSFSQMSDDDFKQLANNCGLNM